MDPHGALFEDRNTQEATCPICCDSILDQSELHDTYCGCGFQLCCFCLNRIQNEGDNTCPHCRTSYEDEPQEKLYEHLSKLVEQRKQAEKIARLAEVLEVPRNPVVAPLHPPPPNLNMKLEEETIWPGLAAPPKPAKPAKPPVQKKKTQPTASTTSIATASINSSLHETPLEYPSSTDWLNNSIGFPSNPASSAPTASGTGTSSPSPSPSPGHNAVAVSYHGSTSSGLVPSINAVCASGQCLINLEHSFAAIMAAQTENMVNLESAALLNAFREALKGGKLTAGQAVSRLMQHFNERNTQQPLFNDSTGLGMISEKGVADAMNNSNIGGGGGGGVRGVGGMSSTTESLFAGVSLYNDSMQRNISMPPGFGLRGPPGFV